MILQCVLSCTYKRNCQLEKGLPYTLPGACTLQPPYIWHAWPLFTCLKYFLHINYIVNNSPWKWTLSFIWSKGCFWPSLVDIGPGEDFKFRHWFFAISSLFLLRKGCDLAFEITKWIPFTQGWFVPTLVAMAKYFWRRWKCEKLIDGWQAIRKTQVIQKDNLWRCTEAMMRNDNLRARWSSVPWFAMIPCKFYKVYTPQPESALDALSAVSSMKYLKKCLRMSMCVYILVKDRQLRKGKIIHIN